VSIELKHLRYAEVAERCGSFRRAAELLAVKQSNLSRGIKHLEEQLGVALFERTTGGAKVTSAGREFINEIRRVLSHLQVTVSGAKSAGRGESGYVTIGFCTSLSAGNLRAVLVEYVRRYPQVEIRTVEGSRSRLLDGIQNSAIDIAIITGEPISDVDMSMALWSERILVALPEDHPLAANDFVYWTDLKHERFLISEHGSGSEIQSLLATKIGSAGEMPIVVGHAASGENIKSLVGIVRGVSLLCEASMGASYAGVVYCEVRDGKGSARIGYRAHWRDGNDNPAFHNFIRLLEERYPPVANGAGSRGAFSQNPDPSP
jgi:DNA-binding transcriptional LysR family regulator